MHREGHAICQPATDCDAPINWELIAQQYDEMIKFATALRLGTADAEAILRRFTRTTPAPHLPTLKELGGR